jgi:hypothetical protein
MKKVGLLLAVAATTSASWMQAGTSGFNITDICISGSGGLSCDGRQENEGLDIVSGSGGKWEKSGDKCGVSVVGSIQTPCGDLKGSEIPE